MAIFLAFCISSMTAQSQYKHEFSADAGVGLSTLQYKSTLGKKGGGLGGHIGAGYTYFITPKWGIHTGAEFTIYQSQLKVNELYNSYQTLDTEGQPFEFRSRILDYKEKQIALYANVPIMFQYHQKLWNHSFYIGLGAKIGIPIVSKYKTNKMTIKNSGYYNEFEPEYTEPEFLGFGTFTGNKVSKSLGLRMSYATAMEVGMKWKLNEKQAIYTGIYFDYALNNVQKKRMPKEFVEYNSVNPKDFQVNSVIYSKYIQERQVKTFTEKVRPIAVGAKVRFVFGAKSKFRSKKEIEEMEALLPPPIMPPVIKTDTITVTDTIKITHKIEDDKQLVVKKDTTIISLDANMEVTLNRFFGGVDGDRFRDNNDTQIDLSKVTKEEPGKVVQKDSIVTNIIKKDIIEYNHVKDKNILSGDVHGYAIGKTALTPAMKAELDKQIVELKKQEHLRIFLEGNTCDIGGSAINRRLGWQRAENVRTYLIEKGIDERRISVVSHGKWDPEETKQNTEETRRKNRRVEITAVE